MAKSQFEKQLRSDEFSGRVIKLCAVFESRLDMLLTQYFARPNAALDFYEHVISRMSLIQKLDVLKAIKLGTGTRSRDNLLTTVWSLRKLRNALAHSYHIDGKELDRLYSDQHIRRMVLGYPRSLSDEKRNMEVRIGKLWHTMLGQNHT